MFCALYTWQSIKMQHFSSVIPQTSAKHTVINSNSTNSALKYQNPQPECIPTMKSPCKPTIPLLPFKNRIRIWPSHPLQSVELIQLCLPHKDTSGTDRASQSTLTSLSPLWMWSCSTKQGLETGLRQKRSSFSRNESWAGSQQQLHSECSLSLPAN